MEDGLTALARWLLVPVSAASGPGTASTIGDVALRVALTGYVGMELSRHLSLASPLFPVGRMRGGWAWLAVVLLLGPLGVLLFWAIAQPEWIRRLLVLALTPGLRLVSRLPWLRVEGIDAEPPGPTSDAVLEELLSRGLLAQAREYARRMREECARAGDVEGVAYYRAWLEAYSDHPALGKRSPGGGRTG